MRRMKDSGIAWIGEIPEGWEATMLKNLVTCLDGQRVPVDAAQRSEGEYPYWGAGNIVDYVDGFLFDEELVLLGEDGAPFFDPYRPVAFYSNEKIWVNNHIHVLRAQSINAKYLVYILNSIDYSFYISGSILSKLTQSSMNKISLCSPPLPEQHRIAAYLDAKCAEIDRSMELVRQGMDKLKTYKMSVITEVVTKGLDPDVPMKDSGVPWIGDIPIKWRIVPLKKQLINIVDYRGKTPEKVSSGVFLVTAKNIKNGKIDYSLSQEYVDENEYYSIMSRGLPKNGDLLFTTEAPLGEVAIVDREDIALAQRIIKFTVNTFILNNLFLKYWITSSGFQFFLHTLSTGSTAEGIKSSKISMLPLVLPSLPEQHRIASYLDTKCAEIDAIIVQKQALLDNLAAYRKSLIFECVTGKREVAA